MTEEEWLACADPGPMLEFLRGRASDRKLQLFASNCYRRVPAVAAIRWEQLRRTGQRPEAIQGQAAGTGERKALAEARREAANAVAMLTCVTKRDVEKRRVAAEERKAQCSLLRDLFGNPFRPAPAVDPAWLAWNDRTVPNLAGAIYADRRFADLPVLADALQDAGCTDPELLGHLRGPGPHARGCWALDLLLRKE